MHPLENVLHGLVDAVAHLIPANRAGELHALAEDAGTAASKVAEAAGVIADATPPETPAGPPVETPAPPA